MVVFNFNDPQILFPEMRGIGIKEPAMSCFSGKERCLKRPLMNNRKCFMEVERKRVPVQLRWGRKKESNWRSGGCVNERICRVCLLCSWVVQGER